MGHPPSWIFKTEIFHGHSLGTCIRWGFEAPNLEDILTGFRPISNLDECKSGRNYKGGCAAAMRPLAKLL